MQEIKSLTLNYIPPNVDIKPAPLIFTWKLRKHALFKKKKKVVGLLCLYDRIDIDMKGWRRQRERGDDMQ